MWELRLLKMMRFPAAWNFNAAIKRRGSTNVPVILCADGFSPHVDLAYETLPGAQFRPKDYGNHLAGTIAAKFNSGFGIDGGHPLARRLTVVAVLSNAPPQPFPSVQQVATRYMDLVGQITKAIETTPNLKVVYVALTFNFEGNFSLEPDDRRRAKQLVQELALPTHKLARRAAERGIVIVTPAGSDSAYDVEPVEAKWASPLNWIAFNSVGGAPPARHVIVVESVGRRGLHSPFSNVNGSISAPGEEILSTVAYDESRRLRNNVYGVISGTGMAGAHVTAMISLMYAYNPYLSSEQVLRILRVWDSNRPALTTPAPLVSAFDALVACREDSLKDLADLDENGRVDRSDFIIFRDALYQIENRQGAPRKDLNGDGKVDEYENVWPRADLNGSGRLARAGDARVVGDKGNGRKLSDLEVMMEAWEDDESVPRNKLPTMLDQNR